MIWIYFGKWTLSADHFLSLLVAQAPAEVMWWLLPASIPAALMMPIEWHASRRAISVLSGQY
jgi:hypothetical protein